jgi:coenzyme PQQ synthesis protein D (PqqD)
MVDRQRPLARSEGLVVEAVGDEVLVYDLGSDEAHSLDAAAASIWRACDGAGTVSGISARVGLSEAAVESTVERLAGLDLLAAGSFESSQHSRRAVLRRGLVVGAAGIAAVPVIRSIVAPTAAQAGSPGCAGLNQSCVSATCCSPYVCCGSNPSIRICVENCVD